MANGESRRQCSEASISSTRVLWIIFCVIYHSFPGIIRHSFDHLLFHLYRDQMETHGGAPYQHFFPVAIFGIGNSVFGRNTLVTNFLRINAFTVVFPHTWNNSPGKHELPGNLCDTLHQIIKKKLGFLAVSFFHSSGLWCLVECNSSVTWVSKQRFVWCSQSLSASFEVEGQGGIQTEGWIILADLNEIIHLPLPSKYKTRNSLRGSGWVCK